MNSATRELPDRHRPVDRVQDLWLAAQALQRDFSLLTANVRDFKDIPGLKFVAVKLP
jgi:predicted nucleic acid-binding protein